VFANNCVSCHGATGQGGNGGPDLTSIPSAKNMSTVVKQVENGGGGMPAFKGTPTPKQINDVSAYVTQKITNTEQVMLRRLLPLVALVLVVTAVASGASATTQPSLIFGVNVSLTRSAVTLSSKQAKRGLYVQFRVQNASTLRRSFSVAGKTIAVPAHKARLLVIFFDARGRYRYVSRGAGTAVRGSFRIV
jgi:hypothetical protein